MLAEAVFFVAGAIFSWIFSRRDSARRALSEAQTREQIASLQSLVEETLVRMREPSDGTGVQSAPGSEGLLAAAGAPGAELQAALMRLKAHLEDNAETG